MKREVNLLLISSIIDRTVLQGIYPLLPVLVSNTGVTKKETGIFMTVIYVSIFFGSLITPKMLKLHFSIIRVTIFISVILSLALIAMGFQNTFNMLLLTTSGVWFIAGIQQNLASILMSYISPSTTIGVNFGKLANTTLIGTIAGSFITGSLIKWLGTPLTFSLFAAALLSSKFFIIFLKVNSPTKTSKEEQNFQIKSPFLWLMLSINIGLMLTHIGRFCLSLTMKDNNIDIDKISRIFGWGALFALPMPYLFGYLSQKVNNKNLLISTLIAISICMLLLYKSDNWYEFVLISFLISVMAYCSTGVSQKLVYELYPLNHQSAAQSTLATSNWIAAISGFFWVAVASDFFTLHQVALIGLGLAIFATIFAFIKL